MMDEKLLLVTGVTGYIGGCLVPRLLENGYRVRMLVRDPRRLIGKPWLSQVELVVGDVLNCSSLDQVMQGVFAVYYLIHHMSSGPEYYLKEIESASKLAAAAATGAVEQIIYLGGLADPHTDIGAHLRSRIQTGETLRQGRVPVTEFRASLVIGSGSISFEMIRYLTEQLPILFGPRWLHNRTQPIAVQNVLEYLLAALENPVCRGKIYEIGGEGILTYADTITIYARLRGLRRRVMALPGIPEALLARMVGILTPVPARIAGPLLGGMRTDSVVHDPAAGRDFPLIHPMDYKASISLALERLSPGCFDFVWEKGQSSFKISQEGLFVEGQRIFLKSPPRAAYQAIRGLGGKNGWLYLNRLWKLRGFVDKLLGGPGLRGRRNDNDLLEGDPLDFYRVEALEPDRLVRLKAELKAPGQGWMEWRLQPQPEGGVLVSQIAYFAPKGLIGFLYWYALLPIHRIVFVGLLKAIVRRVINVETA
jgi:uncharacterized protein YbjT (DUF2867 family)